MYSDPLDLLNNALNFMMYFAVMHHTMERRYSLWITVAAEAVLFCVHMAIGNAVAYLTVIRMLYWPALHIPVLCLVYREKWYRIALTVLILMLSFWCVELAGVLFFYPPELIAGNLTSGTLSERILVRVIALVLLAFTDWIAFLFLRRRSLTLTKTQILLMIGFPFSVIVFLYFWLGAVFQNPDVDFGYAMFSAVLCIGTWILLFILAMRSSRQTALEADNARLSEQIGMQMQHYENLIAQYENNRALRHDIAKHLDTMRALLNNGEINEAKAYFDEIESISAERGYGICENPAADAFLHHSVEECEANGIRTDISASIPASLAVAPSDLICVLGNLMDNAMEACTAATEEDPFIRLRCTPSGNLFLITMENSASAGSREKKKRIPELDRGLGIQILRHIAEKYHGEFSLTRTGAGVRSELTLVTGEV